MSYVVNTGTAYCEGGTRAVSGTGKAYTGMMEIRISFGYGRVDGLISNLRDADGMPWRYFHGDMDTIGLPAARPFDGAGGVSRRFYGAHRGETAADRPVSVNHLAVVYKLDYSGSIEVADFTVVLGLQGRITPCRSGTVPPVSAP